MPRWIADGERLGLSSLQLNRTHDRVERGRRGDHVDVRHARHDSDWNVYTEVSKDRSELIRDDLLIRASNKNSSRPANVLQIARKLTTGTEIQNRR
jgi:hypothetical protein